MTSMIKENEYVAAMTQSTGRTAANISVDNSGILAVMRFSVAIVMGLAITTSVFTMLHKFTTAEFDLNPVEARRIEFTRQRFDTETKEKRIEQVVRAPVVETPAIPKISMEMAKVDANPVKFTPNIDISNALKAAGTAMGTERGIISLLRVPPVYPRNAKLAKIEGYVTMEVVVNPDGSVADIEVVDAAPPRLFDVAAVDAMKRWRFQPKLVNGTAVSQRAQQTIEFKLEGG
ncbi:MAG: energy transducer TonB [Pseudomonadota bacterium]